MKSRFYLFQIFILLWVAISYSFIVIEPKEPTIFKNQTCHVVIDSNKLNAIRQIDFKSYYNQPIDSLLKCPMLQGYTHKRVVAEPIGCLWYLLLTFEYLDSSNNLDYLTINIYPPDVLKYVPKRCVDFPHEQWNMDSLQKERIVKVDVY